MEEARYFVVFHNQYPGEADYRTSTVGRTVVKSPMTVVGKKSFNPQPKPVIRSSQKVALVVPRLGSSSRTVKLRIS